MKVLLDVNVVLDVLLQRPKWLAEAQAIWDAAIAGTLECCLPASSFTDVFYVARKFVGLEKARDIVSDCLEVLTVLPVDRAILLQARDFPGSDFEDAVLVAVATNAGLDAIITRDASGFSTSPIPIMSPIELQRRLA